MNQQAQNLTFEIDRATENPEWDDFVGRCPGAHYEQMTPWARAKLPFGWQSYRILVRRGGGLIGGAQVLHRRVKKWVSLGFISRGPVFITMDLATPVLEQVIAGLRRTGHSYLVVLPHYEGAAMVRALEAQGFFPKPNLLPPSNLVTATMMVDLAPDLETILANMHSSTRRDIRKGLKSGLEVVQGGAANVATFHRLMTQLCERRGTKPVPSTPEHLHELWRQFSPSGRVNIFIARYHSEVVSASFNFVVDGRLDGWKFGWTGEHGEKHPNHVLKWETLKWAKQAGLRWFDLGQVLPAHAEAVLRGEKVDDAYWGVTQYKLGYGGKIFVLPGAYYRSFNPWIQAGLKWGGEKFMNSASVSKWAAKLAS